MKNIWRIIQFIPEYRGRVLGVILVGTALGFIGTATPYLYKLIVDAITQMLNGSVTQTEAARTVTWLLLGFFGLRLAVVILGALQNRQADNLWLDTVSTFRQRVFENMTRKSIDYFERTRVGEIMDRFGNITSLTMWLSSLTDGTLANILQMFFIITVLLIKAPVIGAVMAVVLVLNLAISYRTVGKTRPFRRGWQAQAGKMSGLLAEMVSNIATVRSSGSEPFVKQRYDDTQAEWLKQRGSLHKTEWLSEQTLNVINTFGIFIAVSLAAYAALNGAFTTGDILLVLTLSQNLINTIGPIARQINQIGETESTAERLVELLDEASEQADKPGAIELLTLESICFENVCFSYPGHDTPALNQVSFVLNKGQSLALVGSSGSGKSTIIKLLMRFYDVSSGRILLNGVDIRDYQQKSLRALMGVVLQDVALFNDTLEENIAFARPTASTEEVEQAARAANAHCFAERLENGYQTLVGERGVKLSGGEKQRIAIARAILKNPQLIILDEATSALDSESEQLVQQGLNSLLKGRTSLIIAHRLGTVMNADLILVMQHGQVVEQGSHHSLKAKEDGVYARLLALQTGQNLAE